MTDGRSPEVTQAPLASGCEGDHPVAGAIVRPPGAVSSGPVSSPGPLAEMAGGRVERLDVLAPIGEQEASSRPASTSFAQARTIARTACSAVGDGVHPAVVGVPGDGRPTLPERSSASTARSAGSAWRRFSPSVKTWFGWRSASALERTARPDGAELAVVADDDQLRPRPLDGGEEAGDVDVGRHPALVEDHHVAVRQR